MTFPVTDMNHYFETIQDRFVPEAAKGLDIVVAYELGEPEGDYTLRISDGTLEWQAGKPENPTVTIAVKAATYLKVINGKMKGPMAVMTGKMKIKGSIPMAQKLSKILPTN